MTVSGRHLAVLKGRRSFLISQLSLTLNRPPVRMFFFLLLLSAQRVLSGGGEYSGCSDFTEPERLLPSCDARRLCAAGGQRVVRS